VRCESCFFLLQHKMHSRKRFLLNERQDNANSTFTHTLYTVIQHQGGPTTESMYNSTVLTDFYKAFHSAGHGELFAMRWAGLLRDRVLWQAPALLHHQLLAEEDGKTLVCMYVCMYSMYVQYVCMYTCQHTGTNKTRRHQRTIRP